MSPKFLKTNSIILETKLFLIIFAIVTGIRHFVVHITFITLLIIPLAWHITILILAIGVLVILWGGSWSWPDRTHRASKSSLIRIQNHPTPFRSTSIFILLRTSFTFFLVYKPLVSLFYGWKSGDSESKDLVKIKLTCLHSEQLQQLFFGCPTELA